MYPLGLNESDQALSARFCLRFLAILSHVRIVSIIHIAVKVDAIIKKIIASSILAMLKVPVVWSNFHSHVLQRFTYH